MKRMLAIVGGVITVACSSLPSISDGIVALELRVPTQLTLANGSALALHARAVNQEGDSVEAEIHWNTADTALVTLDSTGIVTARSDTGTARIQASVGSLHSDLVLVMLKAATTGSGLHAVP